MKGEEELGKVGSWWHGLGVTKVAAQVGGKAISHTDTVRNVCVGHVHIKSEPKVMDKGEEHFDEVWEGQAGVVGSEFSPDSDG